MRNIKLFQSSLSILVPERAKICVISDDDKPVTEIPKSQSSASSSSLTNPLQLVPDAAEPTEQEILRHIAEANVRAKQEKETRTHEIKLPCALFLPGATVPAPEAARDTHEEQKARKKTQKGHRNLRNNIPRDDPKDKNVELALAIMRRTPPPLPEEVEFKPTARRRIKRNRLKQQAINADDLIAADAAITAGGVSSDSYTSKVTPMCGPHGRPK